MKQIRISLLSLAFLAVCTPMIAQKAKPDNQEKAIKTVINRFFEGMEKGDTTLLKSTCMPDMQLQTYMTDKAGDMQLYTQDMRDFVQMVANITSDQYDERIKFEAIHAEQSLASVWTPYSFYINGKRSHCGTNSFQLVKTTEGWKIQYILDTRRKQGCKG
ncbi:MAG: nuclear transport factor 2 family protein [Saprospiraceae bacterium]|nr:nuclear transport factor 2 family protein [Saprospiraceae bacterium]